MALAALSGAGFQSCGCVNCHPSRDRGKDIGVGTWRDNGGVSTSPLFSVREELVGCVCRGGGTVGLGL